LLKNIGINNSVPFVKPKIEFSVYKEPPLHSVLR